MTSWRSVRRVAALAIIPAASALLAAACSRSDIPTAPASDGNVAVVRALEVEGANTLYFHGQSLRLRVRLNNGSGERVDVNNEEVTWTSSCPYVAEVAADGRVRAMRPGLVIITASWHGLVGQVTIRVVGVSGERGESPFSPC